ncbi:MAG TPA: SbcC/MukB-like Walker B domain-containing protein, partial [Vulgatibacter sp.]
HDSVSAKIAEETACRDALEPWFADRKVSLLRAAIEEKVAEEAEAGRKLEGVREKLHALDARRDAIKLDIARNGGDRIEKLRQEIGSLDREKLRRTERSEAYERELEVGGLPRAVDEETFEANRSLAEEGIRRASEEAIGLRQSLVDATVAFQDLSMQQGKVAGELEALRSRRSNIPAEYQRIRAELCEALGVDEGDLPFAGELMQVHPDEQAWEGAIERVLRSFGISLLVRDEHYAEVSRWVDRRQLGLRFVYHRIRAERRPTAASEPRSLVRKLQFNHASPLAEWVEGEVARSFNPICCETLEDFRREKEALTRNGQQKGGLRHIKDDRRRIDDRLNYVLGWANQDKLLALEAELVRIETLAQQRAATIAAAQEEEKKLGKRLDALKAIVRHDRFEDLDWGSCAVEIQRRERELKELEKTSDVLETLGQDLLEVEKERVAMAERRDKLLKRQGDVGRVLEERRRQLALVEEVAVSAPAGVRGLFARLAELEAETAEGAALTLENASARERNLRGWLQGRIDADGKTRGRLGEKITKAMQEYRSVYPQETREVDASVEAAHEYRRMLEVLRGDDLPRFERRFKELLNENTIREIANFQAQLNKEKREIEERIESINRSLRGTEFNRGRYIKLVTESASDAEVRDFQRDLRACTENTLSGSDDSYSEAKFLQVRRIIERFRGREGSTEIDERWTRKVTDVRTWFTFSASERWLEDDREHEHYTDSGGKSGGQKEKLAYTVLAASLAYQFGLEWGERRSRSFRFVVIDEAFGRGSDESAAYGLELFQRLNLQLLVVTPLQKLHVIEPFVAHVGFVSNPDGERSRLRNFTIEEYRAEKARRTG